MYEWLESLRILLSFSFLAASSWYDFKTREVNNRMWMLFASLGFILSFLQFCLAEGDPFLILWVISFLVTTVISLALFYLGFFGGADAKALISLSIALPVYPSTVDPYFKVLVPLFPLTVFGNALLGSSLLIFVIAGYNLAKLIQSRGRLFEGLEEEPFWKKTLAFMIGFKVDVDRLKSGSHNISLEYFSRGEDGKIVRHLRISPRLDEEQIQKKEFSEDFPREIRGKIWVTPGLPLLLFVTAGFVAALLIGDIITWLTFQLITTRIV